MRLQTPTLGTIHGLSVILAIAASFGLAVPFALADEPAEPSPSEPIKPWAVGVSQADQDAALRLFEEGNSSFATRSYAAALQAYGQAIEFWDHPAIRFNISECHIHLDQPVEAHENLERALKYGDAPLEEAIYNRALTNQKLLNGQIARIEVINDEVGAIVTLNGEPLMSEPGTVKRVMRPGRHQLVARKDGKLTQTEALVLLPGQTQTTTVALLDIGSAAVSRRWSSWKPWAVVGGGAVLALTGGALQFRARQNRDKFDDYIAAECANGCSEDELPGSITGARDAYETQDVVSVALIGTGAAVLTAGIVLIILNQPRAIEESAPQMVVAPAVGRSTAGVSVTMSF